MEACITLRSLWDAREFACVIERLSCVSRVRRADPTKPRRMLSNTLGVCFLITIVQVVLYPVFQVSWVLRTHQVFH